MKKIIFVLLTLVLVVFVFLTFYSSTTTPEEMVAHTHERWGVELPVPDEMIDVWSTKYPARGDGEWVTEWRYEQQLQPEQLHDFIEITNDNIVEANRPVSHFLDRVTAMYRLQQDDAFEIVLKSYATKLEPGDYYFHHSENGDYDTFTAIYQRQENRILLFEWHQ